jgi:flagellin
MPLGVLNNLSAMYAENNLNKTTTSLNTALQQLSSGSKINSGADDAAGLSLIDGLEANSMALTQSQTNAEEGVGLLQVADGALSQVTSLLNRAVTLSTEASNGTLNSSQDTSANQEYQSILSEINNIGSTTTYNNQAVFNTNTNIYTGDSSAQGASIDSLNIRTLSSANVGDTAGVMSYSNGQGNVFLDLSNGGVNAAATDSLNASGSTTIQVSYLSKAANGATVSSTANVAVGTGTNYQNNAQGLINAINGAGLGLNATFATAAQAGAGAVAAAEAAQNGGGSAADTGIEITAVGIGASSSGADGTGVVGALSLAANQTLGGTLNIVGSDGATHNVTLGTSQSTDTLADLASTINGAGYGITAAVNGAGTQLTFTSSDANVSVSATDLTQNTIAAPASNAVIQNSGLGSLTVGNSTDTLTGTLNITDVVNGVSTPTPIKLGTQGQTDTLANLATTITNGGYGITAQVNQVAVGNNAAGTVLTFTKTTNYDGTPSISGSNITDIAAPAVGQGFTLGSLTVGSQSDTLATGASLTIDSGTTGKQTLLALGTSTGANRTDTLANLAATINNGNYGITASLDKTGTVLTFAQTSGSQTAAVSGGGITDNTYATTGISVVAATTLGSITVSGVNDTVSITGAGQAGDGIVLTGNGAPQTIDISSAHNDAMTLAQLASAVNADTATDGIVATLNATAIGTQAAGTILTFTAAAGTTNSPGVSLSGGAAEFTDTVVAQNNTTAVVGASGALGSLSVTNSTDLVSGTFNITSGTANSSEAGAVTLNTPQTIAQIAADFNGTGTQDLSDNGITATVVGGTQLVFTANPSDPSADIGNAAISSPVTSASTTVNLAGGVSAGTAATLTAVNSTDTFNGVISGFKTGGVNSYTVDANGLTLTQIYDNFGGNGTGAELAGGTQDWSADTVKATLTGGGTILTLTPAAGTGTVTEYTTAQNAATAAPLIETVGMQNSTSLSVAGGTGLGTLTATNSGDLLSGSLSLTSDANNPVTYNFANKTLTQIATDFNSSNGSNANALGITAVISGNVLKFEVTPGDANNTHQAVSGTGISDVTPTAPLSDTPVVTTGATLGSLSALNASDMVSGTLTVQNGLLAGQSPTQISINGTLQNIADSFNVAGGANADLGITASLNTAKTFLTFTQSSGDAGTASVTNDGALVDTLSANPSNANQSVSNPNPGVNIGTLTDAGVGDMLTGTLEVTNSADKTTAYNFQGQTLAEIAKSFDSPPDGVNDNSGISANYSSLTNTITFTGTGSDAIRGTGITDFTPGATQNTAVTPGTILDTFTVANATDKVSGGFDIDNGTAGTNGTGNFGTAVEFALSQGETLAQIADDFNGTSGYGTTFVTADKNNLSDLGITATLNTTTLNGHAAGTVLQFTQTTGDSYVANIAGDATNPLVDQTIAPTTVVPITLGNVGASDSANTLTLTAAGANSQNTLTGSLEITEGIDDKETQSTYNLAGQTLTQVAAAFDTAGGSESQLGITAVLNNAGTSLAFVQTAGDLGSINVQNATVVDDQNHTPSTATIGVGVDTMQDTLTVNNASDLLGGALTITSGTQTGTGATTTLNLGTASGTAKTDTLADLEATINAGGYGITASLNTTAVAGHAAGTVMTLSQSNGDGFTPSVIASSVTDSTTTSTATSTNLGSLSVNNTSDLLTGTLTGVEGDGVTPFTQDLNGKTLAQVESIINTTDQQYGILAQLNQAGTTLSFTASSGDSGTPTLGNVGYISDATPSTSTAISLTDVPTAAGSASSTTVGNITALPSNSTLSGTLTIGSQILTIGSTDNNGATLAAAITKGNYGVAASYDATTGSLSFKSSNSSMVIDASKLDATPFNGTTASAVTYAASGTTSSGYYSVGISGTVTDTSTAVSGTGGTTYGGTANVGLSTDANGTGGTATISYSDGAGQSLSATDLSSQKDAEKALTALNSAIIDVAAQDGYVGAQINTLNAVSSVLTTQQENVVSAQNAVQATDYAQAASNMAKYQILSQTGISALAQANSMQQEVTKLLQ